MKDKVKLIELLYQKVEQYSKTGFELYRLKVIDKVTDVLASLLTKIILAVFFTLFFLLVTIGLALYLGTLLGEYYLGFFALAGVYLLIAIILAVRSKTLVEVRINDFLVRQFFKEKRNEEDNH